VKNTNVESMVTCGSWRFDFDNGHTIGVENLNHPFERLTVPCPSVFSHADLSMFARGWVWAKVYG
jgi:hypothetical protein